MTAISKQNSSGTILSALFCGLLATTTLVNGQPMTLQSVTRTMDFGNGYSMSYFTHNEGGVINIRFTLTLEDYDITNW